jgi:hypothetical protein
MAECDNLVDHPLDLKLLCLSQLRDLKDRIIKVLLIFFRHFGVFFYTNGCSYMKSEQFNKLTIPRICS